MPAPWGPAPAAERRRPAALGAAALLVALALLLAGPALAPGATWYSADAPLALPPWKGALAAQGVHPRNPFLGDQDFLYYPFLRFIAAELVEKGELPLWNPTLYGGVPLAGNAQFPLLYPVHGLLWLSQAGKERFDPAAFDRAFLWHGLARLLICALGAFLWFGRLGAGPLASFAGALVLALGGYHLLWLQFTPAQVFCFIPAALGFLEGFLQRRRRADLALFVLCLAASHHGGYPQTSFFLGGLVVLYIVFRARSRPRLLLRALGAFLASLLLALPAWLPFLEYLDRSEIRALRAGDAIWPAGLAAWRVLAAGLAGGLGIAAAWCLHALPATSQAWKRARPWAAALLAGAGALLLGHPAFGADGELLLQALPRAWGVYGAGPSGTAAAAWSGPFGTNPVESCADCLGRGALLLFLLAPALFRARGDGLARTLWWVGLLAWLYGSKAPLFHQAGRIALFIADPSRTLVLVPLSAAAVAVFALRRLLTLELRERRALTAPCLALLAVLGLALAAWAAGLWPGGAAPRLALPDLLLLALSGAALLWLLRATRPLLPALAVVGLLGLDLFSLGTGFTPATPLSEIYPSTPSLAWLQQAAREAGREGRPFRVMGDRMTLRPNTASVYGLSDARGHDCFDPTAYVRLLYGLPILAGKEARDPAEVGHRLLPMEHRAFDLLGVRFYCTDSEWSPPPGWKESFADAGMRIYENLDALPRAYLARDQVWIHRQPLPFADPSLDPGATVFLEEPEAALPGPAFAAGEARIVEDAPNRVRVAAEADGWAWLVLLDNHYPGWRACLENGEELTLLRAFGTWRAVALPPGRHEVTFSYEPRSWRLGLALAGLGLLGALLLLRWGPAPPGREGRA